MGHHHAQVFLQCISAGNDAADLAGAKHQDTVAKLQKHIKIFTYINDSDTLLLLLIDQIVNRVGGVDIQASYCISGKEDLGSGSRPSGRSVSGLPVPPLRSSPCWPLILSL